MYATHPTKSKLIEAVVSMLDTMDVDDLQVDQVLERSGVSKGSMYHHFTDFAHLIEAAHVYRFSRMIDASIEALVAVMSSSRSRDEMVEGLKKVTRSTQRPELAALRFERARALALAENRHRMREAMAAEQGRLTDAITDICREGQEKGWVRKQLDPRALAVFIQAYTLGKIVDDLAPAPMEPDSWIHLIDDIVERVIAVD